MGKQEYNSEVAKVKRRNASIFMDTVAVIRTGCYVAPSGRTVVIPSMKPMLDGSVCFQEEIPPERYPLVADGTVVRVENEDCLESARRLVSEGYRPALLNFASGGHPGGGVESGARAQEETICRRSTLVRSLFTFSADYSARYGYPRKRGNNYPLDNLNFSAIYSPEVTVFREGLDCRFMETTFQVGVITCAALNLGGRFNIRLTKDGHMPEDAKNITRNKIRTIFRIGLKYGHDSLVLGAFGCGAFKNPPEEMASLFKEVIRDEEFRDKFRLLVFSIIEDHNSDSRNLCAFTEVLGGSI